jgi:hypothetical protein
MACTAPLSGLANSVGGWIAPENPHERLTIQKVEQVSGILSIRSEFNVGRCTAAPPLKNTKVAQIEEIPKHSQKD